MTVYNRTIQIRLTRDEKEQIVSKMKTEGFHNLSAWLRKKLLTNSLWMEHKIDEVHLYILDKKKEEEKNRAFSERRMMVGS